MKLRRKEFAIRVFISKVNVAVEEADETVFWLDSWWILRLFQQEA
jgi:hypothetical protein